MLLPSYKINHQHGKHCTPSLAFQLLSPSYLPAKCVMPKYNDIIHCNLVTDCDMCSCQAIRYTPSMENRPSESIRFTKQPIRTIQAHPVSIYGGGATDDLATLSMPIVVVTSCALFVILLTGRCSSSWLVGFITVLEIPKGCGGSSGLVAFPALTDAVMSFSVPVIFARLLLKFQACCRRLLLLLVRENRSRKLQQHHARSGMNKLK